MDTGDGPDSSAPPSRPAARRLLAVALLVALCAAIATGSCVASVEHTVERLDTNSDLSLALLSGGLAFAVGLLFMLLVPRWPEAKLFAVIGTSAYIPWMLSALSPVFPLPAAGLAVVLGGIIAVRVADVGGTDLAWRIGPVSALAVALATAGFFAGFLVNYEWNVCWFEPHCPSDEFNARSFAITAGCVPSLCAAVGSLIAAAFYRRAN